MTKPIADDERQPGWPGSDEAWLKEILRAPVYDVAQRSPLDPAPRLSSRLGNAVWLKREDLQPIFSFKIRGAYVKLASLSAQERERGVIAVSAGNHAQGVALGARQLGIDAVIVMPVTTPAIKISAVQALGARIELSGDGYSDAVARGEQIAREEGRVMVHPFDDPATIAGQGTVALEMLAQHRGKIDAVFIPVGGGGLCAGMAAYIKALDPAIQVIAVEPEDAACLKAALEVGHPVPLAQVGLFVDGCAVRQIGDVTFDVLKSRVDAVVTVSVDRTCAAIRDVFEETRTVVEPAGALALAGMKIWIEQTGARDRDLIAVVSGANMNFDRLGHITERAEIGQSAEALFGVTIPEEKGSFLRFCGALGKRAITEFNYRHRDDAQAQIFVGIQLTGGSAERSALRAELSAAGYGVEDYTENEVARLHVRHMVGGNAGLGAERLFRFEFPERPGALLDFLQTLGTKWDITLFHYRNRAAAYGRVLAGFGIAPGQQAALLADLRRLGFWYTEESDNPALRQFLG
ncbi:MAG: threonine ammonia-lyase, biosynthetic [Neomegalonema sp.]|nr:threonine ammonia-lyase, biosynthetic [Neomegalonema sp.]